MPDIVSGTSTLFRMTTPPIGWTKNTSFNEHALRVVSGSASSGGSANFSNVFTNIPVSATGTVSGSIGPFTLTYQHIPQHTHTYPRLTANRPGRYGTSGQPISVTGGPGWNVPSNSSSTGSSGAHTHPVGDIGFTWSPSNSLNLAVRYLDIIIATRN
jgi:hypothetical protein